ASQTSILRRGGRRNHQWSERNELKVQRRQRRSVNGDVAMTLMLADNNDGGGVYNVFTEKRESKMKRQMKGGENKERGNDNQTDICNDNCGFSNFSTSSWRSPIETQFSIDRGK
ncbi:hypothetical protein U1Q18_017624, partial [Sarracenia purpurea var. burkii]